MKTKTDYWIDRDIDKSPLRTRLARNVRSNGLLLRFAGFFLSTRLNDETFIRSVIKRHEPRALLDVACGGGKGSLPALVETVYGVDISGYPAHSALAKGYKEATSYTPPDYEFTIPQCVDVITCINLNAHVPFSSFAKIIGNALDNLNEDGILILINEHDNNGLSYSRFRDPEKKHRLVHGMEHYFFETHDSFFAKFVREFPMLELMEERALSPIVSTVQHYVYKTGRDPSRAMQFALLTADVLLGPFNYLYAKMNPTSESFLVAMVFRKSGDGELG